MKKYSWVLALLLALTMAFVFIGCDNNKGDDDDDDGGTLTVPATLELPENQYSTGYQATINVGKQVKKDAEWLLNVSFTVSRAVPGGIFIGLVDTVTNYWDPLSWSNTEDGAAEADGGMYNTGALVAGTEYTIDKKFIALKSSAAAAAANNQLVFSTIGEYARDIAEGSPERGVHIAASDNPGAVTITFSGVAEDPVKAFIKGLSGFTSIVSELNSTSDAGETFNQWNFTVDTIDASDYFVFVTDGTKTGANKDGFGGTKIGFQQMGGSWTMSDGKVTADWTSYAARSGTCLFAIKISELEDFKTVLSLASGDNVRIYLGYWPAIIDLATSGYAAIVKGNLVKPASGAADILANAASGGGTLGFVAKVE